MKSGIFPLHIYDCTNAGCIIKPLNTHTDLNTGTHMNKVTTFIEYFVLGIMPSVADRNILSLTSRNWKSSKERNSSLSFSQKDVFLF